MVLWVWNLQFPIWSSVVSGLIQLIYIVGGQVVCPVFLLTSSFSQLCEGHCPSAASPRLGSGCLAMRDVGTFRSAGSAVESEQLRRECH